MKMLKQTPRTARVSQVAVETLEGRQMLAASPLSYGINANNINSTTYGPVVKMLRDTGTTSVRLWYGFSSYSNRSSEAAFKFVKQFHADGFDVTLAVVPGDGINGSNSEVKGLFSHLLSVPGVTEAVDRWQVGNEPDHETYWRGTVQEYVVEYLKPASEVLHAAGEKVVSAGPSWNPEDIQRMKDVGLLSYADFVGYHPYRSNYNDLVTRVAQVKAIVGGKPLVASEWNVRGHELDSNRTAWAEDVKTFWPVIRDNFYAAYYYAAVKSGTMAGPGGVINTNGSANEPFYSAYKSLGGTFSGGGPIVVEPPPVVPPVTPPPVVPPVVPPVTPPVTPPTTTPTVASIALYNASNDTVVSGYSSVISGSTIDLATLPSRSLSFVASIGGGARSVLFTRDGTSIVESVAPLAMFADNGGDLIGKTFIAGTYTFSAQAFAGIGATGTAGATKTFTLNFTDSGNTPSAGTTAPAIRGYALINNATGLALSGYSNITASTTVTLAKLATRNIRIVALANSAVQSVKLSFTGQSTRIENTAEYDVFASPWNAVAGSYALSGTAYSLDNAKGTVGNTLRVTLKFV